MRFPLCFLAPIVLVAVMAGCDRRARVVSSRNLTNGKAAMPQKPHLKQFGDLALDDFRKHPVWIQCHIVDHDERWYDDTDEETFRPWTGPLPCGPEEGMLLVRAELTLADGTKFAGFITPQHESGPIKLGTVQPHLFTPSGKVFSFWGGMREFSPEERNHLYTTLGKDASKVFPIQFAAESGQAGGQASGVIPGFCSIKKGDEIEIAK
jgi:hypothetical protein